MWSRFFERRARQQNMSKVSIMKEVETIVGIDPGLTGAFCFMSFSPTTKKVTEVLFEKMFIIGREPDFKSLTAIFNEMCGVRHIFLEKVSAMPHQGVSSVFKFGRVVGALQALAASIEVPLTQVSPQTWQREIHEGISKVDVFLPKARSLIAAQRLFPQLNLLASEKSKKPHKGYVDALLIAEYGRRHLSN